MIKSLRPFVTLMEKQTMDDKDIERVDGFAIRSGNIAFKPEDMVACGRCSKANPPNRTSCLYCANPLEVSAEYAHVAKLNLRRLESWEKGFNLVWNPDPRVATTPDIARISQFLSIERGILEDCVYLNRALPIARLESENEAQIAVKSLNEHGFPCVVVPDADLHPEKTPERVRAMLFGEDALYFTSFNSGRETEIRCDDLAVIVIGGLFETRTEIVKERKLRRSKIRDETQTSSDEAVIDIYSRNNDTGFRIRSKGFDFSCLGDEKGLLAAANMQRVAMRLKTFAPQAKVSQDYLDVRDAIEHVWETEWRNDHMGLQRSGFGRKDFTNIASSNNLRQFTMYSRLQRLLP